MNKILAFATILTLAFLFAFMPPKKVLFKGKVSYTAQYCGGAAPSQEMLDEMAKEKPYANSVLCVKTLSETDLKSKPVITKVTTDENGNFSVVLDKGKYALVTEDKTQDFSKGIMAKFGNSSNCISWQNTPDMTFTIAKKSKIVTNLRFDRQCNPCTPPRP